jgi:YtcA family
VKLFGVKSAVRNALLLVSLPLYGCDPVVAVAGAEFPDWLVCVVVGSLLSVACHPLLKFSGLERHLRPLAFFYGSLVVMFSLATWMIFFNRV